MLSIAHLHIDCTVLNNPFVWMGCKLLWEGVPCWDKDGSVALQSNGGMAECSPPGERKGDSCDWPYQVRVL